MSGSFVYCTVFQRKIITGVDFAKNFVFDKAKRILELLFPTRDLRDALELHIERASMHLLEVIAVQPPEDTIGWRQCV